MRIFHKINAIFGYEYDWQKTYGQLGEIVTEMPVEKCYD